MNERERIVNRDLQVLDEAHYGGRIARAEYRARRRNVLAALRDSHGITARQVPLRSPDRGSAEPAPRDDVLPALLGRGGLPSRMLLVVFAAGALVCALLLGLLLFAP
ncbi:hypothetical protein [Frateuria terrea]|uniref:DUF1707 domain-containing protein n=1 Tax=Frateuria terrea TaxID=529704 RepID=A0A1H6QC81_9GAMM|nr:hypothetical protein [Frateuria terrea]SEI41348.1 hypothetical protein SAMN04487997_0515 [Frateuria terrea]SFP06688.1 hypothetical protein SAMN02927913_0431 [Frateuria terrea]